MRSTLPAQVMGTAIALGAIAGCGGDELFAIRTVGGERLLDKEAIRSIASNQQSFEHVTVVGDLDGDGLDDAMIPGYYVIPGDDIDQVHLADSVYILYGGGATGEIALEALPSLFDFGFSPWVTPVGDVDGDGLADVLISYSSTYACPPFGPGDDDSEIHSGQFLIYGSATRFSGATRSDDAGVFLRNAEPCRGVGAEGRLGDLDGDGKDDFAISAFDAPVIGMNPQRRTYVFYGRGQRLSGTVDLVATADAQLVMPPEGAADGYRLVGVGDVDGDGKRDYFVHTILETSPGRVDGSVVDLRLVHGNATRLSGKVALEGLPQSRFVSDSLGTLGDAQTITALGDLDGDGIDDFALLGASPGFPAVFPGGPLNQRVFYGRRGGFPDQVDASTGDATLIASAYTQSSVAGTKLASGDIDGDGIVDLVMSDTARHDQDGSLYVLRGTGARLSGQIDPSAAADATYIGSRIRLQNCKPIPAFDCVEHEEVGSFLGVGRLTGKDHADVLASAPWYNVVDGGGIGFHGPPGSHAYVVSPGQPTSPAAAARP